MSGHQRLLPLPSSGQVAPKFARASWQPPAWRARVVAVALACSAAARLAQRPMSGLARFRGCALELHASN
eukprot:45306-Pyramimonas_sp.AAC.1